MEKDFEFVKNAVTDVDGNTYDGIRINEKLWMASNLRTTKFNDGTSIGRFDVSKWGKLPYFEYPDVDKFKLNDYGLYYNFEAVNTGLLAPKGWHVPSKEEWEELFAFVAQHPEYNLYVNDDKTAFGSKIAKSLCSKDGWRESSYKNDVGCEPEKNNATGFNLFPAGYWNASDAVSYVGYYEGLWSSNPYASSADDAWHVGASYNSAYMYQNASTRANGRSVRCARNEQ